MRDMKATLGEADMILLGTYDDEAMKNSEKTMPDISKMVPSECAYSVKAVEAALYNFDEFIQSYLQATLKWETIILMYGNLRDSEQVELMFGSNCDTCVRESITDAISRFLIGRPWPINGTPQEEKDKWKLFITAAIDKYSRPQEYF